VHHGIGAVERLRESVTIGQVAGHEPGSPRHGGAVPFGEVVEDRDVVARVEQLPHRVGADVAGAPVTRTLTDGRSLVVEAELLERLGVVDVAPVEDRGWRMRLRIRSKSGSRNSFHSVTSTSASAPVTAS